MINNLDNLYPEEFNPKCWYCNDNIYDIATGVGFSGCAKFKCNNCNIIYDFFIYRNSNLTAISNPIHNIYSWRFYAIEVIRPNINIFIFANGDVILQTKRYLSTNMSSNEFSINDRVDMPKYFAFEIPINKLLEMIEMIMIFQ